MEKEDNLAELEAVLQVTFHDRSLLQRALTHHSCCPETSVRDSYETLEFLGDAILGAHVVEYIYRNFPHASEGEMTALKSEVVSRRVLARDGNQSARSFERNRRSALIHGGAWFAVGHA